MGRCINSFLSFGAKGQISIINFDLQNILHEQEPPEGTFNEKKTDFYVGPSGFILPYQYQKWIGVSRRNRLLKKAKNSLLINAINDLYRKGAIIGDGGTASALLFERRNNIKVNGTRYKHEIKVNDYIKYIRNKVLTENLSAGDRKLANKLLKDLMKARVR